MDERIEQARKNILIKPITSEITHTNGLPGFTISFQYGDPRTAQLVCGEITSLFLGENLKSREASAEGTTDFLKGQLADAKKNLDEQDAKLAQFQRANVGKLPNEESPNFNMFQSLNAQLEAVNQDIARIEQGRSYGEAMLAQMAAPSTPTTGAAGSPALPAGSGTAAQQAELQSLETQQADLLSHYTADYPDVVAVKRKISDLRKEMALNPAAAAAAGGTPALTKNDSAAVQQLRAQIHATDLQLQDKRREQADIQANIRLYQERIQASPLIEAQYKSLTRDYQTAQAFYDDLLTKMNQSKMATDLEKRQQGEQFRIEDEPNLPTEPTSPKRPVFVMGGLALGLAMGLAIVALLEYKDTALRSERDVWAFTNLPTLATIDLFEEAATTDTKTAGWPLFKWKGKSKKAEQTMEQFS
jgi:polysaccharide chain length determinant protein (PEP-CTERM system associated)